MSNKLLAEGTIRRFMKLANVDSLTDSFIQEMGPYKKKAADLEKPAMRQDEVEDSEADVVEEQEEEELEMDLGGEPVAGRLAVPAENQEHVCLDRGSRDIVLPAGQLVES